MSESDDTDILLLIPPDVFAVASSVSSTDSLANGFSTKNPVVSGLLEHVQLLENRINAIETKDSSILDRSLTKNSSFSGHKFDLPNNDNSEQSRFFKSPSASLKKCHLKSQSFLSPIRSTISSSTSTIEATDRKQNGMESRLYPPTSFTTNKDNDELQAEDLSTMPNSKSTKSNEIQTLPLLDLKFESKEPILKTNSTGDFINEDYTFLRNHDEFLLYTDPKSVLDRITNAKKKIQKDNYQHSSSSTNEINTLNSRNYNFSTNINSTSEKGMSSSSKPESKQNSDSCEWKSHKLLSLADFWEPDSSKSEVELLRIKLEEEKFRREHCEQLIQELQKRLLEQQEKVAVAIGIDKEKNSIISQYQIILNKLKEQWKTSEHDHKKLQKHFAEENAKNQVKVEELEEKIKSEELEKTKFMNSASEYKEKCEVIVKEKIEILESHANELENYKSFVTTAESRYDALKNDYDKLTEKNQQLEQSSANFQQELYRERLKAGEIRNEMGVINKALDTCEAELTVLRQEKENLQLRWKEEKERCSILDQKKSALLEELNRTKENEDLAKKEIASLVAQQEQIRSELRGIYQKQVDKVVKVKLKEFQSQLDTAESAFQTELDSKQRMIAECAARKIKSIIDKHQLEINLLEEKHKEEICLYDIKVSQLKTQLNAQQEAKSRVAEQLHSLMEKQWKQALQIISPEMQGNFEIADQRTKSAIRSTNGYGESAFSEPIKLPGHASSSKSFHYTQQEHDESRITFTSNDQSSEIKLKDSREDLKKYIKMILQMQDRKEKSFSEANGENDSSASPISCRQVPRKYYTKVDAGNVCEKNVSWEPVEGPSSIPDTVSITQIDNKPLKPPWK